MKRAGLPILIVLCTCMLAGPVARASIGGKDDKNIWQLLDFKEREIIEKLGITNETSKRMGVGIMQNALTRDEDPKVRATCAKILGRFEAKSASVALIWALKDTEVEVRKSAAQALGVLHERRALKPLTQLLKKEPDWAMRWTIVVAMRTMGDRRAAPLLIEPLLKDPDWRVRKETAVTLGALQDKRATKHLAQALSDPHEAVRAAAAGALGALGDKRALDALIEALKDKDPTVRAGAAAALGALGSRKAVTGLIECLGDENATVRANSAGALGVLGSSRAVGPLKELAASDPNLHVKQVCKDAIDQIKAH